MEIRIIALRLRNFKGVRQAEYFLDGYNARFEGPNGSGKSTVFDAFTWLLFGKDHRDQTADTFELKTIDPATGRPFPREDHWVEAVLTVDGQEHVLRRAWIENWVKPAGEVEDVMKGHTTAFFVDGVDVGTKRAYDAVVAGWMPESVFKLLTNPLYFIDDAFTPWKNRRKALLDLVKDSPERARVREEFADVIEKLTGRSIEDYRKRLALEKAANKRDLAETLSRIDGMREALPEEIDTGAITARLKQLRAERDETLEALQREAETIDRAIASADEADAAKRAENRAIQAELATILSDMDRILSDAKKAALVQNNGRAQALIQAKYFQSQAQAALRGAEAHAGRTSAELAEMDVRRADLADALQKMGDKYRAAKESAFEYTPETRCPHCGQEIPAATIEEARAKAEELFKAERKAFLDGLIKDAKSLKEEIGKQDARIAGMKDILAKLAQEHETAAADAAKWEAEIQRLEAQPGTDLSAIEADARNTEQYKALSAKEQELREKAVKLVSRPDNIDELVARRKSVEQKIAGAKERCAQEELEASEALSVHKVRQEQLQLIEKKKAEAATFADALARGEREEARAAEFVKADICSVEEAINCLFKIARWKMFDYTLDGGIVETCEVTTPDGVPYKSMNDAAKTECGMDCIRVFSERYGSSAPIFIDNAESIIRESFGTPAQVIRLVVKDRTKITLINE